MRDVPGSGFVARSEPTDSGAYTPALPAPGRDPTLPADSLPSPRHSPPRNPLAARRREGENPPLSPTCGPPRTRPINP
jgi:hypothetical protein